MKTDGKHPVGKPGSDKGATETDSEKQKKQLIMLSGLAVLLVAVLYFQFGGSESEYEAAALADVSLTDSDPDTEDGGTAATDSPVAKDNPVLLQTAGDDALSRNAFSNFWDKASADDGPPVELTPPAVVLSGTMPSAVRAVAIVDGRMRFVGDTIDGWELSEIRPRAVTLKGPGNATVVIDMPVIFGRVTVPEELDIPVERSAVPSGEGSGDGDSVEPEDG